MKLFLTAVFVLSLPYMNLIKAEEISGGGFVANLRDGSILAGNVDLASLHVQSELGKIQIPIEKIKSIVFSEQKSSPKIFLVSGDIITGAIDIQEFEFETIIGRLKMPIEAIESLQRPQLSELAASFSFDGNAEDQSGNGINGTVNGATPCENQHGKKDSAYCFDGEDDYIHMGTSLPDMKEMTLCAWVYAENNVAWFTDGDWAPGKDLYISNGPTSVNITCDKDGKRLVESVEIGDSMHNQWRHIGWTLSPDETKIYVNGELKARLAKGGSNVGNHNVTIGTQEYPEGTLGWGGYWKGKISQLNIYAGALTDEEVKLDYQNSEKAN